MDGKKNFCTQKLNKSEIELETLHMNCKAFIDTIINGLSFEGENAI